MTDRMAALAVLSLYAVPERQAAFDDFYRRYDGDPLVIDKWFALQAVIPEPETLDRVRALTAHPAFSLANPNRVRALIGNFAQGNQTQFNRADGAGYAFHADTMIALDAINPQVAARLMTAFRSWRVLEPVRRGHAEAALKRVAAAPGLSRDVSDIVVRSLGTELRRRGRGFARSSPRARAPGITSPRTRGEVPAHRALRRRLSRALHGTGQPVGNSRNGRRIGVPGPAQNYFTFADSRNSRQRFAIQFLYW